MLLYLNYIAASFTNIPITFCLPLVLECGWIKGLPFRMAFAQGVAFVLECGWIKGLANKHLILSHFPFALCPLRKSRCPQKTKKGTQSQTQKGRYTGMPKRKTGRISAADCILDERRGARGQNTSSDGAIIRPGMIPGPATSRRHF